MPPTTALILGERSQKKLRLRCFDDLDKRTNAARAAIELRDGIAADLGGYSALTAMQRALLQNVATLGAMLEDLAAGYLSGEQIDRALYATLANTQRRLLVDLGLERKSKDVAPDLQHYLKSTAA